MPRPPVLTHTNVDSILRVSAGILRDTDDRILITERLGDAAFADLWEFPGGKIAADETPAEALQRELAEELGISATGYTHFMRLDHQYPDRHVSLDFFLVDEWRGQPVGLLGQRLRWQAAGEVSASSMLPADAPVLRALQELKGRMPKGVNKC